jgi:hypothetical protein
MLSFSKTLVLSALACASTLALAQNAPAFANDIPPNARAGECYAKVFVAPTTETFSEQVLRRAASSRIEVIPATYETGNETVTVQEASKRIEVIPATYKTVSDQVLVRAASKRVEVVPATYEEISEQVVVAAAYSTWKRGRSHLVGARATKGDNSTDDVLCLVEVPAQYKTVTKRVEKTAAQTREVEIPAEYTTITKRVVDTPASTREIEIPAVYKTVAVRKTATPAQERKIDIPAEFGTVTKTRVVGEPKYVWRGILCETNATQSKITEIQRALKAAGHNPGKLDGVIRSDTMRAVRAYQTANNLPVDDYINLETVKALGLTAS